MDAGPQAYGAGKVGGEFNIQNFVRKPHVFVRLLSLVRTIENNIILYHNILYRRTRVLYTLYVKCNTHILGVLVRYYYILCMTHDVTIWDVHFPLGPTARR